MTYILYNMIRIKIRMTMDNEPKHFNSFFIGRNLHVTLCIVRGMHFGPPDVAPAQIFISNLNHI